MNVDIIDRNLKFEVITFYDHSVYPYNLHDKQDYIVTGYGHRFAPPLLYIKKLKERRNFQWTKQQHIRTQ